MVTTALKTIEGICRLYKVLFYIDLGERIGIYNAPCDNFHVFIWRCDKGRYIWDSVRDNIPDWTNKKVGIISCTNEVVQQPKLEKTNDRTKAA